MTTGETITRNIIDMWEQAESYNLQDVLELCKDIVDKLETTNSTKLSEDMNEYIEELCKENKLCPECLSSLIITDKNNDLELNYCPVCRWNEL